MVAAKSLELCKECMSLVWTFNIPHSVFRSTCYISGCFRQGDPSTPAYVTKMRTLAKVVDRQGLSRGIRKCPAYRREHKHVIEEAAVGSGASIPYATDSLDLPDCLALRCNSASMTVYEYC